MRRNSPGCPCCGSKCSQTFIVGGCHSIVLPGATVTIWKDDKKQIALARGTTDSHGSVDLSWVGSCSVFLEITYDQKFKSIDEPITLVKGGFTSRVLLPSDEYACIPCCAIPLKKKLHVFGFELNWDRGRWVSCRLEAHEARSCRGLDSCDIEVHEIPVLFMLQWASCFWDFMVFIPACIRPCPFPVRTLSYKGSDGTVYDCSSFAGGGADNVEIVHAGGRYGQLDGPCVAPLSLTGVLGPLGDLPPISPYNGVPFAITE